MMRSADEIKKGLECCHIKDEYLCECEECPYSMEGSETARCDAELAEDCFALIQQLEADKQQLEGMLTHMNQLRDAAAGRALQMEERVHQLEAERDALLTYLTDSRYVHCSICKHNTGEGVMGCKRIREVDGPCFEWRGVQKEE